MTIIINKKSSPDEIDTGFCSNSFQFLRRRHTINSQLVHPRFIGNTTTNINSTSRMIAEPLHKFKKPHIRCVNPYSTMLSASPYTSASRASISDLWGHVSPDHGCLFTSMPGVCQSGMPPSEVWTETGLMSRDVPSSGSDQRIGAATDSEIMRDSKRVRDRDGQQHIIRSRLHIATVTQLMETSSSVKRDETMTDELSPDPSEQQSKLGIEENSVILTQSKASQEKTTDSSSVCSSDTIFDGHFSNASSNVDLCTVDPSLTSQKETMVNHLENSQLPVVQLAGTLSDRTFICNDSHDDLGSYTHEDLDLYSLDDWEIV